MEQRTCAVEDCPESIYCRGFCTKHYQRWRKHGDPLAVFDPAAPRKKPVACSINGCPDPAESRGWCSMHYTRWHTHGDPLTVAKRGTKPRPRPVCSIDGCDGQVNSHGLCGKHDQARRRYGDPLVQRRVVIEDIEEWFLSKLDKQPGPDGCWLWTESTNQSGYSQFGTGQGKTASGHRWSYEHFVEPIPEEMDLDHLCHTRERLTCSGGTTCLHRRCVRPDHLQPVPPAVNSQRGVRARHEDDLALALYFRWRAGERQVDLASEAGISQSTVSRWVRRLMRDEASQSGGAIAA